MKRNFFRTTLFTAVVLASSTAFAAEPMTPSTPGMPGAGDMSTHHKMVPSEGSMGGAGMGAMMGGKSEGGMKGMMCGGGGASGASGAGGGGMCGGMMGKMGSGQGMMGKMGAPSGGPGMPKLPPGNEKLEFQMHAEMMQKIGEIALKYADRIKEN